MTTTTEQFAASLLTFVDYDCRDAVVAESVATELEESGWGDVTVEGSIVTFAAIGFVSDHATLAVSILAGSKRRELAAGRAVS